MLVIETCMTDGKPSNAPLNWATTMLIGSVDVGKAALYDEGLIGNRPVGAPYFLKSAPFPIK